MSQTQQLSQQPVSKGFAITSMVLGIVALVFGFVAFLSIPAAIVGLVFGIIALVKKYAGRGMALAGVITSGLSILLSIIVFLMVFIALPALQQNQRDTSRKNDVMRIQSDIIYYQSNHRGQAPTVQDLDTTRLSYLANISDVGEPTTEIAVYRVGETCSGDTSSARAVSVTILLESGTTYCVDN